MGVAAQAAPGDGSPRTGASGRPRPFCQPTTVFPYNYTNRAISIVAWLLKRWNAGTHHYRVEREHLQYYLDEFTFRFNRRRSAARGMLFYRLLQQSVNTDPHPLRELIIHKPDAVSRR